LAAAAEHGLFVLLEAFDEVDLELARDLTARRTAGGAAGAAPILIGVNSRDLQTLKVRQERFARLAPLLPGGWPAVAESGVATAADARHMQQLGYGVALIGTALMSSEDPSQLLREILAATRTVQA
jgi:indole-3-glycerol phosphate synthase